MDTLEYLEAERESFRREYEDTQLREKMRELGKKGGRAVLDKLGKEHYREMARKVSKDKQVSRGRRGGAATWKKLGVEHYRAMARKGVEAKRLKKALREFSERLPSMKQIDEYPLLPFNLIPFSSYPESAEDIEEDEG